MEKRAKELRYGTELRAVEPAEGGDYVIEGMAIVYDRDSVDMGFTERILRGSVRRAEVVVATFNHKDSMILGHTENKKLELEERAEGIFARIFLNPQDPEHVSVWQKALRKDLRGFSFEFMVEDEDWQSDGKGNWRRYIKALRLYAVNPVISPAYPDTMKTLSARGLPESLRERLAAYHTQLKNRIRQCQENKS